MIRETKYTEGVEMDRIHKVKSISRALLARKAKQDKVQRDGNQEVGTHVNRQSITPEINENWEHDEQHCDTRRELLENDSNNTPPKNHNSMQCRNVLIIGRTMSKPNMKYDGLAIVLMKIYKNPVI